MYWSDNWPPIDTGINSAIRREVLLLNLVEEIDSSVTKRILYHLSTLLGRAFQILLACQSVHGGSAQCVAHATDKVKRVKSRRQRSGYKSELSPVSQQQPPLGSALLHHPPLTPQPKTH